MKDAKIELPKKTKIAAWWMIIGGILFGICMLFLSWAMLLQASLAAAFHLFWWLFSLSMAPIGVFIGLLLSVSGFHILKRRKIGWICGISILSLIVIIFLIVFLFISFVIIEEELIYLLKTELDLSLLVLEVFGPMFLASLPAIIYLVPLIFLLREKKEFWKIAT